MTDLLPRCPDCGRLIYIQTDGTVTDAETAIFEPHECAREARDED